MLAELYLNAGQKDKAFETYKKVLEIDPGNPYIHLSLADYYRKNGEKENMSSGKITRFQNNVRVDGDLDLSNSTGNLTVSSLASAPSSPTVGDTYYDTTLGKFRVYQLAGWTSVDGTAAASLDAAYNGGASITVDGGAIALTDSQTDTTGGLLITKSGAVTGADSADVLYVNSSGAHDTSGRVSLLRLNMQTETASTPEGARITMNADSDNALKVTKGSVTLDDGDLTLTSAGRTTTCGVNITVANTSGDGVNVNIDTLTTGDGFVIDGDQGANVNYLAVQHGSANVFTVSGTLTTSEQSTIIDTDSAEAFLIREDSDAADVLTVDTTQDAADTTMLLTTKVTTGSALHVDASTITTGQGVKVTVVPGTMTAAGAAFQVYDATNAREVFAVRDDGSVYMYGTAEGTTATQTVAGDMVVSDGDLTLSGGEMSVTDGVTTSGQGFHLVSSVTTAIGMRVTADAVTSGDILYLDNGGATMTAAGYYINCNDDNTSVFSVGYYGDVTIAGNAATTVFTITAGNIVLADGGITLTETAADQFVIKYDASNTFGVDVDSDGSTTLTTVGTDADFEIATGTTGDITLDATGDIVLEAGGADITADAQLTITTAANEASLVVVNNTATTGDSIVDVSSTSITTGALMRLNANTAAHDGEILELISAGDATSTPVGLSITIASPTTGAARGIEVTMAGATTTAKGIAVTMDALTTGDMLYLDNGGATITGDGKFINCNDDDTSKFAVAADGNTTIAGTAAGTAALTLSLGDLVVTDSDSSTMSSVNGTTTLLTLDNAGGVIASGNAVLKVDAGGAVDAAAYGILATFSGTADAGASVIGIIPDAGSKGLYVNAGGVDTGEAIYVDADPTTLSAVYLHSQGALAADKATLEVVSDVTACNADSAVVRIEQAHATGVATCLALKQDDVDIPFITFEATAGVGNAIEEVAAKSLTTTHFVMVDLEGTGPLYFPIGTIA